jgi:formiminotetrahydrofolate cyclodeaminase
MLLLLRETVESSQFAEQFVAKPTGGGGSQASALASASAASFAEQVILY